MIEITFLVDHPEVIPTLAQWFRAQWPEYYAERTQFDIAQDFHAEANRNGLPVRLIAFANDKLAGTITLRERAFHALPEYRPGLGGLFVAEQHRNQGIGTDLVRAGMKVAWEQGYERVYATTFTARGILERLGWIRVRVVSNGDEQSVLYSCELENRGPTPLRP